MSQVQLNNALSREYVVFNPQEKEHLEAFYHLRYEAKQHPELRFLLEEGYPDVPTMMLSKITETYLKQAFMGIQTDYDFKMKGY